MKHLRNGFYLGIMVLVLLATGCTLSTLSTVPPTPSIVQAPNSNPVSGQAAIPQNPNSLLPGACPLPSYFTANTDSFCANAAAGQGGATIEYNFPNPSKQNSVFYIGSYAAGVSQNDSCSVKNNKLVCSGPQGTQVSLTSCSVCGVDVFGQNALAGNGSWATNLGLDASVTPYQDREVPTPNGGGIVSASSLASPCPTGYHFDWSSQACVGDTNGKVYKVCPDEYPYYGLDAAYLLDPSTMPYYVCYMHAPLTFSNCETITVTLGTCTTPQKKNTGGGGTGTCTNPVTGGPCQ